MIENGKNYSKLSIAAYCRISVDDELGKENTSIENQKAIISEYVGLFFPNATVDYYEDRDRSGYTFEQRENYQVMRVKLFSGKYDILIVKDLSRFSRRNSRGLVEIEDLRDVGIRIIAIGDNIDYPTNDDWFRIQFDNLTTHSIKNRIRLCVFVCLSDFDSFAKYLHLYILIPTTRL